MADWYASSTGWSAVAAWSAGLTATVGMLRRQLATPTVGNERVWRCTTPGTTGGSEPAWTLTKGSTTGDNGVVWTEVTGSSAHQQDNGVTNTWTAPHARLATACTWANTSDRIFVSSDHAETQSTAITITAPGAVSSPNIIVSVNRTTGNIPPIAADITNGASISTTGASNISIGGSAYFQGLALSAGSSSSTASIAFSVGGSAASQTWKNCAFVLGNTSASSKFTVASSGVNGFLTWDNSTVQFGATGQTISLAVGVFTWKNTANAIQGATIPINLFTPLTNSTQIVSIRGVDLSAIASGNTLYAPVTTNTSAIAFIDCKLASGVTISSSPLSAFMCDLVNCDSGATGYRNEFYRMSGSVLTETTITRTGGASDGVQKVSHKNVSNANTSVYAPLEGPPYSIWNTSVGVSKTLTIEIISSGSLNNNDIWVELDYLGSSGSPIASFVNNSVATPLTAAAAQTSSSAAWDNSPSTPVTQRLQVTFTPQMAGLITARVRLAKASTTVYVDPPTPASLV